MLKIYNSLTNEKEIFTPLNPQQVGIYVCGITVYDYCHIGHARSMLVFDVIVRYLHELNYQVNYVRNITDVDDKIIKRANENKQTINEVTAQFIQAMQEDTVNLGMLTPTSEPRATNYMAEMIQLIEQLLAKDAAYVAEGGDVYFDVRHFPAYGKLSRRDLDKLKAGVRIEINDLKRDPLDFILWKMAKPGEPMWDSPWGQGRPGWHIECSAMSSCLLGQPFDIHGGGLDLKFPHHDNEIAQSEAAKQRQFANIWMHVGLLQLNNEKMSKSLGNYFTIRQVLAEHHVETLRYFMLSAHYRSPINYSNDNLLQAYNSLKRLYVSLLDMPDSPANFLEDDLVASYKQKFRAAMNDDFNTPLALAALFEIAHHIQRLRQQQQLDAALNLAGLLKHCGGILGILQREPLPFLQGERNTADDAAIEDLILAREQARKMKKWQEADQIRDQLQSMGVIIEDSAGATRWRRQ